jgi:gas vesicle protein
MTRGNNILLAALGGAAVGALLGSVLTTERGRQLVDNASSTIKDLSSKATEYAKQNIGEVIRETKDSLGGVVKEKIAERMNQPSGNVNQPTGGVGQPS